MGKNKRRKLNLKALDLYVIFSITSLVMYTIISQAIAIRNGVILDTLTTCFFGFFGGEIVTCGLIKIFKLRDSKRDDIGVGVDINNANTNINNNSGMAVG